MTNKNAALLQLNLGVIFLSTSGVLGKYITLDSTIATWWRVAIASVLVLGFCLVTKVSLRLLTKKDVLLTGVAGVLLGTHFVTYFYALDYSNVAIGLLTLFTFPAFTAVLEPILLKTKYKMVDIFLAMFSLLGIYIIAPSFDLRDNYTIAIGLGLFSAFAYALRNITIKKVAEHHHGSALMFHQLWVTSLLLLPAFWFLDSSGWQEQMGALFLLAFLTTTLGHTLFVMSLKNLSATTAGLLSCMTPVYGILWAYLFLAEVPAMKTVVGGLLIIAAVFFKTVYETKYAVKPT